MIDKITQRAGNWWNRGYAPEQGQEAQPSWLFNVEASVRVPKTGNDEQDSNTAKDVLSTVLNQIEGDASLHTAIDSSVRFQIQFEPIKGD